jgi:hypothetical protein
MAAIAVSTWILTPIASSQAQSLGSRDTSASSAGDTVLRDTLVVASAARPAKAARQFVGQSLIPVPVTDDRDRTPLPFARGELPVRYPRLGMNFGAAHRFSSFASVDRAFRKMEDVHRAEGYSVPRAPSMNLGLVSQSTFTLQLTPTTELACESVQSFDVQRDFRAVGGLLSRRYLLPTARKVAIFAGLGAGRYRFSFVQHYGVQISPVDPNGGYNVLETIRIQGSGFYWAGSGGLRVRASRKSELEVAARYLRMPDETMNDPRAGRITVNMSSALLGVSYTYVF